MSSSSSHDFTFPPICTCKLLFFIFSLLTVVTVRFEEPTYTVTETEPVVEVCIVKDLETAAARDIILTTRDGTASSMK